MFCLYTPSEANQKLIDVRRYFESILSYRDKITKMETEMQEIMQRGLKFKEYTIKKQELNTLIVNYYAAIRDLEETGVSLKNIDRGLVDFPSIKFGEEVWLCWKYGEDSVKFWHRKEEGFEGRRPLETTGMIEP